MKAPEETLPAEEPSYRILWVPVLITLAFFATIVAWYLLPKNEYQSAGHIGPGMSAICAYGYGIVPFLVGATIAAWRAVRLYRLARREERTFAGQERLTPGLAAVRGTVFRIDVPDINNTLLRVYEGEVEVKPNLAPPPSEGGMGEVEAPREIAPPREVSAQQWMEIVSANQQLSFTRGEKPVITDFDPEADSQLDWVQWNQERDEGLDRSEVPPPDAMSKKEIRQERRKNRKKG